MIKADTIAPVQRHGQSPFIFVTGSEIHLVYVSDDSIQYISSVDKGQHFSEPVFVGYLPKISTVGGRGPQLAGNKDQLIVAAADETGNIYCYTSIGHGKQWVNRGRINDVAETAKEGFVALAANNEGNVIAIWLDLRQDEENKIYGSRSIDGGKTWSTNRLIYRSPDKSVCECCKPSVVMRDHHVAVMFRNWLDGNRDLYLTQSSDEGLTFNKAQKLGEGSWALNACPMDGGSLVMAPDYTIYTIWRRKGEIYICEPGKSETLVAEGKQCVLSENDKNYFIAFVLDKKILCRKPNGQTVEVGEGMNPKIVSIDKLTAICTWEDDGKILTSLISGS